MSNLETIDISCALHYDPFVDDFGSSEDRTLRDQLVVARKDHICFLCGDDIREEELHRVRVDKFDGEIHQYRWCYECCVAMAVYDIDPDILHKKYDDGRRKNV